MRKIYYVSIIFAVLIVSFLSITYSYSYEKDKIIDFKLVGPGNLYIDVDSKEKGLIIKQFDIFLIKK